jgi:hypothetical protein
MPRVGSELVTLARYRCKKINIKIYRGYNVEEKKLDKNLKKQIMIEEN